MRWLLHILFATALCAPATAQTYPEVEALKEYFFAEDVDALAKHLPQTFVDRLNEFPKSTRKTLLAKFFLARTLRKEGATLVVPENLPVLLRVEKLAQENDQAAHDAEIVLEKRISDGSEAVLKLWVTQRASGLSPSWSTVMIWMRYEYGEWRISSATADWFHVNFDSDELVSRVLRRPMDKPEEDAALWASELMSACLRFRYHFDRQHFPDDLTQLTASIRREYSDGTVEHSAVLHLEGRESPYDLAGYQISYHTTGVSESAKFELSVRPARFGVTGKRSFFADEGGHLRWTDEDRAARADDPILN